jgi:signal transduction histidine kinase
MALEVGRSLALRPQELEAIYAISRVVVQAADTSDALDQIIKLTRPVFIFDNMVLYLEGERGAELAPAYARVIGRGRGMEADLAWGEAAAEEAYATGKSIIRHERAGNQKDRLNSRFHLALPLRLGGQMIGALVFIRFGGPPYAPDHIRLAEFIAAHIAQLLEHNRLVSRVASLEAERRLTRLQDDFIATVSHELLTPLGFIKGYATTLLRQDTEWDEATRREFLTIIDEETDRLGELIDKLLDSSRLQSGTLAMDFRRVAVAEFISQVVRRNQARYPNLTLRTQVETGDLEATLDPYRMGQVFDNLLGNAVKYAPGAAVTVKVTVTGNQVQVEVADRGPGISPQYLPHLFGRFYRVPEHAQSARGTGLGLFICRNIVLAHGGDIRVESIVGQGTVFRFEFPIEQPHTAVEEVSHA